MGRLPERWLRDLYERADLRQIAGRYMRLEEKGGRLWGCCPFHHETKPSFSISPQKGFYHCFGCGKHGNAVSFIMEMEHLNFREACEYLAQQLGMAMPEDESPQDRQARSDAQRAREMNRAAAAFYHRQLALETGAPGQAYLAGRGVPLPLQARYGLGYAPEGWHHLRDYLLGHGFTAREMIRSGLLQEKNGSSYDIFRGRVMFPIISPQGEVLGFGGRILGDGVPKYLNSPATPAFNKSRSLYNLNTVKALKNKGTSEPLILMEGYMDVVGAACFGVENTCATLGTALTAEQSRLIRRYAETVHICYDGDAAGTKAALRALQILEEADLKVRVVHLPDNMDPDEYLQAHGRDAYLAKVQKALAPMAFRFHVAARGLDLRDPQQRAQYAEACLKLLREEKSAVVREEYLEKLQVQTGYSLRTLREDLHRGAGTSPGEPARRASLRPAGAEMRAENFVAAVLGGIPDLAAALVLIVKEEDFEHPGNRAVYSYIRHQDGRAVGREELLEMLEEKEAARLQGLLRALGPYENDPESLQQMLSSSVRRLSVRRLNREISLRTAQLKKITDPVLRRQKQEEILQLTEKLHAWKKTAAEDQDHKTGRR